MLQNKIDFITKDLEDNQKLLENKNQESSCLVVKKANTWVEEAPTVMDFDASEDQLEVDIQSHEGRQDLDDFDIKVEDFEDGSGASIYIDGVEVMRVPGAQGLNLADVQLNLV